MKTIKNISNSRQAVTGIPAFEAGESKKVTDETAEVLLRNPNFKEDNKKKSEKTSDDSKK